MTVSGCGSSNVSGVEKKNLKELETAIPEWYNQAYGDGLACFSLEHIEVGDNKLELTFVEKDKNIDYSLAVDEALELLERNEKLETGKKDITIFIGPDNYTCSFIVSNYSRDSYFNCFKDDCFGKEFEEYKTFVQIAYRINPTVVNEINNHVDILYVNSYTLEEYTIDSTNDIIKKFKDVNILLWPDDMAGVERKGVNFSVCSEYCDDMIFWYSTEQKHSNFDSYRALLVE